MACVIKSFANKRTQELWETGKSKGVLPPNLFRAALRKLVMVNDAAELKDLAVPPGNRLEPLRGDREGQHSIRINDRYRICFVWRDGNAYQVEVVDYH
ncbi:MAG: type II toxin-antitoxin system RelE/ParE family toxin [Terriglobales bacterium]